MIIKLGNLGSNKNGGYYRKITLYTLIEDCSCPEDFLNCTEEDAKDWEEESSKAVIYFELIKNRMTTMMMRNCLIMDAFILMTYP